MLLFFSLLLLFFRFLGLSDRLLHWRYYLGFCRRNYLLHLFLLLFNNLSSLLLL